MQCGICGCELGRKRRGRGGWLLSGCPQDSSHSSLCQLPGRLYWTLAVRKERILRHSVTMGSAALMLLLVVLLFCRSWSSSVISSDPPINDRPVIGIVAQETHFENLKPFGQSYIAASYIKYLESAGARVIPIRIDLPKEEYVKMFNTINGVLLPGGGVDLETSEYARVSKIFYDLAIVANDRGDYFPFWGTCLGFEEMTVLTSGQLLLTRTDTDSISLALNFTESALGSKLFQKMPPSLYEALSKKAITANFHSWSLSLQNYTANEKLGKFYNVLSTNSDGILEFVSTMEARKNLHQYSKEAETAYPLIYNYCPTYTGNISAFEQIYFF
ncbi:unnamed protein product [Staurois parvus]|uniref:folate gamma-glutamyl hydrolase n=1 Tax=Staurois parvus TaxID=386267 RepID=A0ABN9BSD5_9NEOB|nr:unnamed protein product [Staurois parvus]